MKHLTAVILSVLLAVLLSLSAFAVDIVQVETNPRLVVDDADLLTQSEEEALLELAREISARQACDVVLVTAGYLNGSSPEAYADDYFDYNGYGQGADRSGILFLISMEERDWHVSTRGMAIQAFTDDGIEYLVDQLLSDLSGGYYYDAFRTYFTTADTMLSVYNGTATEEEWQEIDQGISDYVEEHGHWGDSSQRSGPRSYGPSIVLALVLGFVLAFIPMAVMKSGLNNIAPKRGASDYLRPGSMQLNLRKDLFLYTNTTSRVIETQRSSGGGGSSTHVSSSGATHGGHGGKF